MATRLTPAQIYNAARGAGFGRAAAIVATAIALAESGGNPAAHNPGNPPGAEDSWGLWQINVKAHPQYRGWDLTDPSTNARAAYAVSNGGRNFAPWSTYGTAEQYGAGHVNTYAAQLPKVYAALGIGHGEEPPDTIPGADVPAGTGANAGVDTHGASWWKPWTWGSAIAGDVAKVTLTSVFTVGGIALVVAGLFKGVTPAVQKFQSVTPTADGGPTDAAAASGAASKGGAAAGGASKVAKVAKVAAV